MIVCKFGGSSLSDGECFEKSRDIILSNRQRKVVVVSAPGKGKNNNFKVTDLLIKCCLCEKNGVNYENLLCEIHNIFASISKRLNLKTDIGEVLDEIKTVVKTDEELAVSRGEYLSAKMMAEALGFRFVDAKDVIIFDYAGRLNKQRTMLAIKHVIGENDGIVVPGFYGGYPNGAIKLMARGGSDVTGSIIASMSGASLYENWTDVSGVMRVDPAIYYTEECINKISYSNLKTLSFLGARVLFEDAVLPVEEADVPIRIKNTFMPSKEGTIISSENDCRQNAVGIAVRQGYSMLLMDRAQGEVIGRKLFSVIEVMVSSSAELLTISVEEKHIRVLYKSSDEVTSRITAIGGYKDFRNDLCVVGVLLQNSDRLSVAVDICAKFNCFYVFFEDGVLTAVIEQARCNSLCEKIYNVIFVENN